MSLNSINRHSFHSRLMKSKSTRSAMMMKMKSKFFFSQIRKLGQSTCLLRFSTLFFTFFSLSIYSALCTAVSQYFRTFIDTQKKSFLILYTKFEQKFTEKKPNEFFLLSVFFWNAKFFSFF